MYSRGAGVRVGLRLGIEIRLFRVFVRSNYLNGGWGSC